MIEPISRNSVALAVLGLLAAGLGLMWFLMDGRQPAIATTESADAKLRGGDWNGAIAEFSAVLDREPANPQARAGRALAYYRRNQPGDLEAAQADVEAAGGENKPPPSLLLVRGALSLARTREFEPARAHFQEFRRRHNDPDGARLAREVWILAIDRLLEQPDLTKDQRIDAYSYRGIARLEAREYDAAIPDLDRWIALDSQNALAFNNRGFAKASRRAPDLAGAIADYTEAIRLNQQYADALNNRGKAYRDKNEYDTAIADYNQAIAINGGQSEFYANRALAKYKREKVGDLKSGLDDCARALALNADDTEAYLIRGLIRVRYNLVDEALADFARFTELRPNEHQRLEDLKLDAMERPRLDARELDLR